MTTAITKHEDLMDIYKRLGVPDMLAKERAQYLKVCAYYGYRPRCAQPQPVQLRLF